MKINERYDSFQKEAVSNIIADFKDDRRGRFLLVIPTGGGKTTTAVKAVSGLFNEGILSTEEQILWVVHRDELRTQAIESFERFALESNQPWLPSRVHVEMLGSLKQFLAENSHVRFAVIDEAHHAAANSYQPLFQRPGIGILGLTATPSRHDAKPLQFSKESYSVGFPDLVQMGVLLRPTVIRVDGGAYDIDDIGPDSTSLEVLNNDERNARIVAALMEHRSKLNKVIIYAGTKDHARAIYETLKASSHSKDYEAISLILGGNERRKFLTQTGAEFANETRKDFIASQKGFARSILVNVDVLTEGYDDPSVNAIVMARPTNSKLVYMQALGRAVRIDPQNEGKEAFVIEVEDVLPNITYRIDNRWLYSDISDLLEPNVSDVYYESFEELQHRIVEVFDRHKVSSEYRVVPEFSDRDRVTMLLFKMYAGRNTYTNVPVVITNETRQAASGFFNYLADRMEQLQGLDFERVLNPVRIQMLRFEPLTKPLIRKLALQAMENAWELVKRGDKECSEAIKSGQPWISFVAFRKRMTEKALNQDFLDFTEDMQNKETIRESLLTDAIGDDFYLVKFPLPLKGTWGVFLSATEFDEINDAVKRLRVIPIESDSQNQWHATMAVIGITKAAVEQRHVQSLTTIVREEIDFFRRVCEKNKRSVQ